MNSKLPKTLKSALMLSLGLSVGGCTVEDDTSSQTADTGSSSDPDATVDGTVNVPDAMVDATTSTALPPIPLQQVMCTGEETELEGPCCVDVYCMDTNEAGVCPESSDTNAGEVTGLSFGSGDCLCEDVTGPYAPRANEDELPCCYLVGVYWCSGRPMFAQGTIIRATPIKGKHWQA